MFTRILVPLDGQSNAHTVMGQALVVARATGASISVVQVVNHAASQSSAQEYLDAIAQEFGSADVRVSVAIRTGTPAAEILDELRARQADLVVMRTRGQAGLTRAVLGSVTETVVQGSPVPVMLLQPNAHAATSLQTVLIPVDGSPGGAIALSTALALAGATSARLDVLQVVIPVPMHLNAALVVHGPVFLDPSWDADAETGARAYVDSLVRRLVSQGARADGVVRIGASVPDVIVEHATTEKVDLIVMSSEGHTGVTRALLGSVTDAVVRAAPCAVLVLRMASQQEAS